MTRSLCGLATLVRSSAAAQRWLTAAVVGALFIARRPASFFAPQLWAEDGAIFYAQALVQGPVRTLFEPYAGYLQLVPRLASVADAYIPAIVVPIFYSLIAYGISMWACSLFIDRRFANIIAAPALRFLVCCAIAVVPPANELIGTITNSHWYLSLAAFLFLIGKPLNGRQFAYRNIWSAFAVLTASLSGAETLFFAPIAIWRVVSLRDAYARAVPTALLAGVAVQILSLTLGRAQGGPSAHSALSATVVATGDAFMHRVVLTAIGGQGLSEYISAHSPHGVVLGLFVVATIIAVAIVQRLPTIRARLIALTTLSLLWIATALDGRGLEAYYPGLRVIYYGGERYFMFPIVSFILCVAIALDAISLLAARTKCMVFAVVFAGGVVLNFELPVLPDLHWSSYAASVDRWIRAKRKGEPAQALTVPINPLEIRFRLPSRS